MKPYLLFAGETYYPLGGWDDFKGDYDTLNEAIEGAGEALNSLDWAHVINLATGKQIWSPLTFPEGTSRHIGIINNASTSENPR